MANRALIKMKPKPQKPERKIIINHVDIPFRKDNFTLEDLRDKIDEIVSSDNYVSSSVYEAWIDDCYECGPSKQCETILEFSFWEPEEDYQKRLDKYHKDLKKYNDWYEKNRDKIEAELVRREEVEKAQQEKAEERRKKNLLEKRRLLENQKKQIKKEEERLLKQIKEEGL